MPLYAYRCYNKDCNNTFDSIEKVDTKLSHCPKCGNLGEKILDVTGTTFKLRGRGWSKHGYNGPSNEPPKDDINKNVE